MLRSPNRVQVSWARPIFSVLPIAGLGLILGVACLYLSALLTLEILVGGLLVLLAIRKPEIGLLTLLVVTSSIVFEDRLPVISVGVGTLHLPDMILLGLFGLAVIRELSGSQQELPGVGHGLLLAAFLAVALLSTALALLQGRVDMVAAKGGLRTVASYSTFFVVAGLVRDDRQLNLLVGGIRGIAVVVALAMIAQFSLGDSVSILPGRTETLVTQGAEYSGILRLLPPGQSIILVGLITCVASLVMKGRGSTTILNVLETLVLAGAVILTFNRSFWVGSFLAFALLAILATGPDRRRLLVVGFVGTTFLGVALALVLSAQSGIAERLLQASLGRLETLSSGKTIRESSVTWRIVETEYAVREIAAHPLLGLGLGSRYRPFDGRLDSGQDWDARGYIHNGHLWLILATGLIGYSFFIWLSGSLLARGLRFAGSGTADPLRGSVAGFALAYMAVVVGSIVNPMYMQRYWTPLIGIMLGVIEVKTRRGNRWAAIVRRHEPASAARLEDGSVEA
jgi:hypothetical protein